MTPKIQLDRATIPLDHLLFDPNNPRFFDFPDWDEVPDNMYHLDSVQNKAFQRIEGTQNIDDLRKSIKTNGYIPAEMIVVRPYEKSA